MKAPVRLWELRADAASASDYDWTRKQNSSVGITKRETA
jgi:hypothetical protein